MGGPTLATEDLGGWHFPLECGGRVPQGRRHRFVARAGLVASKAASPVPSAAALQRYRQPETWPTSPSSLNGLPNTVGFACGAGFSLWSAVAESRRDGDTALWRGLGGWLQKRRRRFPLPPHSKGAVSRRPGRPLLRHRTDCPILLGASVAGFSLWSAVAESRRDGDTVLWRGLGGWLQKRRRRFPLPPHSKGAVSRRPGRPLLRH